MVVAGIFLAGLTALAVPACGHETGNAADSRDGEAGGGGEEHEDAGEGEGGPGIPGEGEGEGEGEPRPPLRCDGQPTHGVAIEVEVDAGEEAPLAGVFVPAIHPTDDGGALVAGGTAAPGAWAMRVSSDGRPQWRVSIDDDERIGAARSVFPGPDPEGATLVGRRRVGGGGAAGWRLDVDSNGRPGPPVALIPAEPAASVGYAAWLGDGVIALSGATEAEGGWVRRFDGEGAQIGRTDVCAGERCLDLMPLILGPDRTMYGVSAQGGSWVTPEGVFEEPQILSVFASARLRL